MPMYHNHILGWVVRRARAMRAAGASATDVVSLLKQATGKNDAYHLYDYLVDIFLQQRVLFMNVVPPTGLDAAGEERAGRAMDRRRDEWLAEKIPELPRIRDYFAFLQFAKDEGVVVAVCGFQIGRELLLHGVYDAESGQPVWSAKRGERLRAALNRRLGAELIRRGPHDDWESRNDPAIAKALTGPQAPAIDFNPDGDITNYVRWEDMARNSPYDRHWSRLYPNHQVQR
jgi:hypothetical protein